MISVAGVSGGLASGRTGRFKITLLYLTVKALFSKCQHIHPVMQTLMSHFVQQ